MKKFLFALFAICSVNAFADSYNCTFSFMNDVNLETSSITDTADLSVGLGGSEESRLEIAKKSVKVSLQELKWGNYKGLMAATAWMGEATSVGEDHFEASISGTVNLGAKVFQLSTIANNTYYNLTCKIAE